jgi:APA family basic amino acid/polyamine antiporter
VVLRRVAPDLPRPFRCPFVPWVPLFAIGACVYMMLSLPTVTWLRLAAWLGLGLVIYFAYGVRHSRLLEPPEPTT